MRIRYRISYSVCVTKWNKIFGQKCWGKMGDGQILFHMGNGSLPLRDLKKNIFTQKYYKRAAKFKEEVTNSRSYSKLLVMRNKIF